MEGKKIYCKSCHKLYLEQECPDTCYECGFPFNGSEEEQSKHVGSSILKKGVISDASNAAKKATNLLFVLAALFLIRVAYAEFSSSVGLETIDLIINFWVIICFLFCAGLMKKNPILFSILPLVAIIGVYALNFIADSGSIFSGIILKIIIITLLSGSIYKNFEAEKLRKKNKFLRDI